MDNAIFNKSYTTCADTILVDTLTAKSLCAVPSFIAVKEPENKDKPLYKCGMIDGKTVYTSPSMPYDTMIAFNKEAVFGIVAIDSYEDSYEDQVDWTIKAMILSGFTVTDDAKIAKATFRNN